MALSNPLTALWPKRASDMAGWCMPMSSCETKASRWRDELHRVLKVRGKTDREIADDPKGARWKIEVAAHLRCTVAAPHRWIANALNMGSPLAVRVNVCRLANG